MKKDWQSHPLGDLCNFQRGLTYSKKDETDQPGTTVLRATNIDLSTNLLDLAELRYIRDSVPVPDAKKIKSDRLLICTASGSKSHLGKVAYIDIDTDYAFGGFMGMLTPKAELLPRFLFHVMTAPAYKTFIGSLTDGTNINNLRFDALARFQVPVPPLPEQRRIVASLDEAFGAIDRAKEIATQNVANAHELFESYLKRMFSEKGEGWEETTLGDVCDLFQGLAINAKTKHLLADRSQLPLLRIKDLRSGTAEQYVAEDGYPPNSFVDKNDLIYTRTGQVGLVFRGRRGVLHNNCFKIHTKEGLSQDFLYWWLQNPVFRDEIVSMASRAAQPDITHKLFKSQCISVPPLNEQADIYRSIESLFPLVNQLEAVLERKMSALDELKASLLHQAFTGNL